MENFLAVLNGAEQGLGDGAVLAIVAIILVFGILALIIGITSLINFLVNKFQKEVKEQTEEKKNDGVKPELDEDMTVAVLVASIDMRNETKKNVKVVSVKRV